FFHSYNLFSKLFFTKPNIYYGLTTFRQGDFSKKLHNYAFLLNFVNVSREVYVQLGVRLGKR
ncbi:MAG: hypothetical protein IKL63_05020, partial [Alistipes sp.]|nr:hypothetical protein [Alistipes sp.]